MVILAVHDVKICAHAKACEVIAVKLVGLEVLQQSTMMP
jgi:hypothetical protein